MRPEPSNPALGREGDNKMGWSYTKNISFKAFIDELNRDWDITDSDGDKCLCLRHCYRGNPSGGRLWQVRTKTYERYISLYLIRYEKDYGWGKKPMDEETGPLFYDCPLKYLDLVPCPKIKSAVEWRQKVYEYHNNRVAKRLARKGEKKIKQEMEDSVAHKCNYLSKGMGKLQKTMYSEGGF
jgi:hypothetical protein